MIVFKLIYSLALNNSFSYRKVSQSGVNSLSKMVMKNRVFFTNISHNRTFAHIPKSAFPKYTFLDIFLGTAVISNIYMAIYAVVSFIDNLRYFTAISRE